MQVVDLYLFLTHIFYDTNNAIMCKTFQELIDCTLASVPDGCAWPGDLKSTMHPSKPVTKGLHFLQSLLAHCLLT